MKLLLFDHDSLPKGLYSSLVPDWSVDTSRAWPATHACVRGMSLFSLILIGPWSVPHPGHRPDTCASTDSTSQGTLRHHLEIQTECLCATVHVSCAYDDSVDARVKG